MASVAARALVNFRDAAGPGASGYATSDGATMRTGRVYRSDNAPALGTLDTQTLADVALERAFDLRSASERRRVPSVFSAASPRPHVTVFEDLTSFNEGALAGKLLSALVERQDVAGLMDLYYRQLPEVFAKPIGTILGHLATHDGRVVVHCRGGKDRTGFVVAVLHRALGVSEGDALADYLASAGLFEPGPEEAAMLEGIERRTGTRLDARALAPMMTVEAAYLEAAFAAIDERFGDFDRYLSGACRVDDALRERLAARLTSRDDLRR